jgi:hypothetical protein
MGLPRVETECWRSLGWGKKYLAALERLIADKECCEQLRFLSTEVLEKGQELEKYLYEEARRIQGLRGN